MFFYEGTPPWIYAIIGALKPTKSAALQYAYTSRWQKRKLNTFSSQTSYFRSIIISSNHSFVFLLIPLCISKISSYLKNNLNNNRNHHVNRCKKLPLIERQPSLSSLCFYKWQQAFCLWVEHGRNLTVTSTQETIILVSLLGVLVRFPLCVPHIS